MFGKNVYTYDPNELNHLLQENYNKGFREGLEHGKERKEPASLTDLIQELYKLKKEIQNEVNKTTALSLPFTSHRAAVVRQIFQEVLDK
jgi:flagellar biosynthesis/type III secretory pathway protein FliH